MSARLELVKMGGSDAAARVLLKTVGIVIVVWLIMLSFSRNYLMEMWLDNFSSEMVCSLKTKIIDWKQLNVAVVVEPSN